MKRVWFLAGRGHYVSMVKTDTRGGNSARLVSPYINSTGKCLELFYWIRGEALDNGRTHLTVIAITEEHEERELQSIVDMTTHFPRLYLRLPDGTHRIAVEGKRSNRGFSALSLDDVTIMDCDRFGMINKHANICLNCSDDIQLIFFVLLTLRHCLALTSAILASTP